MIWQFGVMKENKVIRGRFSGTDIYATVDMFRTLKKLGLIRDYWWSYHSYEVEVIL